MENVTDALKIAFAVFVFILGLAVTMHMFSLARQTSELVLQTADETTYYTYVQVSDEEYRIVGLETIIPTMYKYSKENYIIRFLDINGNDLPIYRNINELNLDEEIKNHEPWTIGSTNKGNSVTTFLNNLINGKDIEGNVPEYIVVGRNSGGIIKEWATTTFEERIGIIEEKDIDSETGEEIRNYNKTTSKKVITYKQI